MPLIEGVKGEPKEAHGNVSKLRNEIACGFAYLVVKQTNKQIYEISCYTTVGVGNEKDILIFVKVC